MVAIAHAKRAPSTSEEYRSTYSAYQAEDIFGREDDENNEYDEEGEVTDESRYPVL